MSECKKCRYCEKPVRQERATVCANCHDKKEAVHRLWLICQEIKKATKVGGSYGC